MRAALELALQDYPGALVLVSHDRHLLGVTCDDLWRVAEGGVQRFDGDLDDYAAWLAARERSWSAAADASGSERSGSEARTVSAKDRRRAAADQRAREKPLRDTIRNAEAAMAAAQARLAEIEAQLCEPQTYQSGNEAAVADLMKEQARFRRELASAEEAWLAAVSAMESLQ